MNQLSAAFRDVNWGLRLAPLWLTIGWNSTIKRFRRTVLGPFWLSSGVLSFAIALAFVFGGLMGVPWRESFPHILLGIMSWSLIGGMVAEGVMLFVLGAGMMQSQRMPLSFHVFLHAHRALVNFVCQLIVALVVLAALGLLKPPHWGVLIGIPIVLFNGALLSFIVAIPSTRFRDLAQIISLLMQVAFFLSPIFWKEESMPATRRAIIDYNPFAHMLALIRDPLEGQAPALIHYAWTLGFSAVLVVVALIMLAVYRRRVIFWL